MILAGFVTFVLGMPLFPNEASVAFLFGMPMIVLMITNYLVAVLVSWLLFQTSMLPNFYGQSYSDTLPKALPTVLVSMTAAAVGMNPAISVSKTKVRTGVLVLTGRAQLWLGHRGSEGVS